MTTEPTPSLSARMYPSMQTTAAPAPAPVPAKVEPAPATAAEPAKPAEDVHDDTASPIGPPQLSVDELVNAEPSLAERMHSGDAGIRPDTREGYAHALDGGFSALEQQVREVKDQEAQAALLQGRADTAALLHELEVPTKEAAEVSRVLGEWHGREALSEDQKWDEQDRTMEVLRKEFGRSTEARIVLAQEAAKKACLRLPWLADVLAKGGGNDPALIKRFADIGLRQRRKSVSKVEKK